MAIEWDDIRIFQTAVRSGNYSTAARRLDIDRTTVGRRFARLEAALGHVLWEQTATGYRPTPAGRSVLRAAALMERAMARLEGNLADWGGGVAGSVRLAGTAGIANWLLPGLTAFLAGHGDLSLEIVGARDAIAAVNQRHADLGIAITRAKPRDLTGWRIGSFLQGRYRRQDIDGARRIGWGRAMLLANPQPWARLNAVEPGHCVLEVDGLDAMHESVRAGAGSAWLWRTTADRDTMLVRLEEQAPASAAAELWIVHRGDLIVESAVVALRDATIDILTRFIDHDAVDAG